MNMYRFIVFFRVTLTGEAHGPVHGAIATKRPFASSIDRILLRSRIGFHEFHGLRLVRSCDARATTRHARATTHRADLPLSRSRGLVAVSVHVLRALCRARSRLSSRRHNPDCDTK